MERLYATDGGAVFYVRRDLACYVTGTGPPPAHKRRATAAECRAFRALRAAMWEIITGNMGLCHSVALEMKLDPDEVCDAGMDALMRAAVKWRLDGRGRFSTFAHRAITNAYINHLRRRRRHHELPADLSVDGAGELERVDLVQYIAGQLSPEDKEVLLLRFWKGMTVAEMAAEMGTCKSLASGKLAAVIGRCREIADE